MSPYSHVCERFQSALYSLATGEGDVRSRLYFAYNNIHYLQENEFPPGFYEKTQAICRELVKHGPDPTLPGSFGGDAVRHTLSKMRNRTGRKIAQRICDIAFSLIAVNEQKHSKQCAAPEKMVPTL